MNNYTGEEDSDEKKEEYEARINYVHSKIPHLIKIDNELSKTGVKIFSASFGDKETLSQRIESLKKENFELQAKRASLLEKAGFPLDYTNFKYDCEVCRDTGYTHDGICPCYRNALVRKQIEQSGFASVIDKCSFNTKDAFWHAKNVHIKNSTVNGEYLGWYSENLTFENCIITGTQPFCYAKGLTLINCQMQGCDLSFERSEVNASLTAPILSIKNPIAGRIEVPSVGEIILDYKTDCKIVIKEEALV